MKRRLLRWALIGAVLAAGGFIVAASGIIPVKASAEHAALTRWFLRFSMQRSVATHSMGIKVPPGLGDPALVVKGATHYEVGCRSCHGAPGAGRLPIAHAMMPRPPELPPRIRESEPRKLFFMVKHGMKFTGMPAWPSQQRDDEVWAMVAFLLKMPELDAAGYRRLVEGEPVLRGGATTPISDDAPGARNPVLQSCLPCHAPDGLGRDRGAFPKLAGQRAEYLANALDAYARGTRHSGIMEPIAARLDPAVMKELADHYAGLDASRATVPAPDASRDAIERGRAIALDGIPSRRVPACVECHGPGAKRGKPAYPSLVGQDARYLELQLQLFQREERGGSAYAHLMLPVASRLKEEEMRDVALYFESLTPAANQ